MFFPILKKGCSGDSAGGIIAHIYIIPYESHLFRILSTSAWPPFENIAIHPNSLIASFRHIHSASIDRVVGQVVNFSSRKIYLGSICSSVRSISFVSCS